MRNSTTVPLHTTTAHGIANSTMTSLKGRSATLCCALLRIQESSAVHKALVRAIVQVTGYGKQYVKAPGLIQPRDPKGNFARDFEATIEHFLENRKGGVVFFPLHIPDYEGWDESYLSGRLVYNSKSRIKGVVDDPMKIREGLLLLFENLRDHPTNLNLEDTEVLGSFAGDSCEVCGSDDANTTNAIVFCGYCGIGSHQGCSSIYPIPIGDWYCSSCAEARQSRKHARNDSDQGTPTPVRKARISLPAADSLYIPSSSLSSPVTPKQMRSTSLAHSSPSKWTSPCESGEDDQGNTDNRNVPGRLGTFNIAALNPVGRSSFRNQRSFTSPLADVTNCSIPRAGRDIRNVFPNNDVLTKGQIASTTLYVRVDDETSKNTNDKIYRAIALGRIDNLDNVFTACIRLWDDELIGRTPRVLAYLPTKLDGLTEFVTRGSDDIQNFLKLVKAEWDRVGEENALNVRMVLMVE